MDGYGYYSFDELQAVGTFLRVAYVLWVLGMAFAVCTYILNALGLYTVARRREIKNPWLAWVPVGDCWILGNIADQYQFVCRGRNRNRRKILLWLQIALVATALIVGYVYTDMLAVIFETPALVDPMYQADYLLLSMLGTRMLLLMLICMAMWALSIVALVFYYISLYDFYASCRPDRKVLYLVLSILISVTVPFFVFSCRYADAGMPPRRVRRQPLPPTWTGQPTAPGPQKTEF